MKKILNFILVIFAFLFCNSAFSQQQNPVSWKTSSKQIDANTYQIIFSAEIQKGWHLYDLGPYEDGPNPTVFTFDLPSGAKLSGDVQMLDKPVRKMDEQFKMEIGFFENKARFAQNILLAADASGKIKANVEWMCCDDNSCLAPTDMDFTINLGSEQAAASTPIENNDKNNEIQNSLNAKVDVVLNDNATLSAAQAPIENTQSEQSNSLWGFILAAISGALLALITPCVFPMIPMTVSFFMHGKGGKAKGRFNSIMYGIFIVLLYTLPIAAIIIITRAVGNDDGIGSIFNFLSTHWIPNIIFFIIFMIFAASFFGAFEIVAPSNLVNKSDKNADRGGLVGVFFMALTLVLISFSCTVPIVGSVLVMSTKGVFWTPILTILVYAIVFALPFVLFAMFPAWLEKLPKSGGWLNSVKVVLGFIEIALGLKFLSIPDLAYHWGILDREVWLAIWIVVFSLMGFYLLGKIKFAHDSDVTHIGVGRLTLVIITFSFVIYLIPGMFGAPLKFISGFIPPMHTQDFVLGQTQVVTTQSADNPVAKYSDFLHLPHNLDGFFDLKEAEAYAEKVGKPLFIDFTGHGCANCREMESRVWSAPEVLNILRNDYVICAVYIDDKKELPQSEWVTTKDGKTLKTLGKINSIIANEYGAFAQPHYILQGKNKKILMPARGHDLSVAGFVEFLKKGIEEYKKQ